MHDKAIGVRIRQVSRTFPGGVEAVRAVDLDLAPGEFVALLGASGSGKSTLLRMVAGLDRPTSGSIEVERSHIGFVFQDAHLLPWRNVLRNVALPLELMGKDRGERLAAAEAAIAQVGLSDAITRYPNQLSGGMRMRASIARALVTQPRLLLLDEPFAALDEITRQRLDEQLRELWAERKITVLFVTHSISEAAFLAERAIVFSRRPARVILDRRIELPVERTAELRVSNEFARETQVLFEALSAEEP
jgi:NitT/TauT family transport system ATP-binding protein